MSTCCLPECDNKTDYYSYCCEEHSKKCYSVECKREKMIDNNFCSEKCMNKCRFPNCKNRKMGSVKYYSWGEYCAEHRNHCSIERCTRKLHDSYYCYGHWWLRGDKV